MVRYTGMLKKEIQKYADKTYIRDTPITAVYFGGGTPSILPPAMIEDALKCVHDNFSIAPGTELSFEGEVRTLKDKERLRVLRDLGCTRVSFGVQTFDPRSRRLSGIKASEEDILECVENLHAFGYDINLDLMYGLPGQFFEVWRKDILRAIDLGCANIDIYDTVLYPHTALFRMRHRLKGELPSESERIRMLEFAIDALSEAGFTQTTVEDFARPCKGYLMKKLVYGGCDGRSEIIALGASAVGLVRGHSYRNLPPQDYLGWSAEERDLPIQLMYRLTDEDFDKRALAFFPKVLGLQKKDVDPKRLSRYRAVIEGMKARQLVTETETTIEPTKKGLLWTDNMAMEFLESREQARIWKIGY
jgi:oxygen-independent coproporphyrinogen-3 oxidase